MVRPFLTRICHGGRSNNGLNITARQYGEVVLPDAASGQGPGTRASGGRFVTEQGGYGACFCRHGTNFIACWCGRGTKLLSGQELLPVQKFDR